MVAERQPGDADLARLNMLAASGDRAAAQQYLSLTLPYLRAMASRIVPSDLDADDALSEAIFRLLHKWNAGSGPREYAYTYVIRTIRNIVVDEFRSLRSRNVGLEQAALVADPISAEALRRVELSRELELVRRAMQALPDDQRRVLNAVIANGQKPAQLSEELGRNPAAVSNLLKRAKASLRREVLVTSLSEGEPECQRNAARVPRPPQLDWRDHDSSEGGIAHILSCKKCQGQWARWSTITSGLGVLSALAVAYADDPSAASATDDRSERPGSSGEAIRALAHPLPVALRRGLPLAVAGTTIAAITLATVAVTTLITSDSAKPPAHLAVETTSPTTLGLLFHVDAPQWQTESISITITGGNILGTPQGWQCDREGKTLACTPGQRDINVTLSVLPNGTESMLRYDVQVHATAGEYKIDGTASGTFPTR